jgi:predicted P-loop ATPase/GTPase
MNTLAAGFWYSSSSSSRCRDLGLDIGHDIGNYMAQSTDHLNELVLSESVRTYCFYRITNLN